MFNINFIENKKFFTNPSFAFYVELNIHIFYKITQS